MIKHASGHTAHFRFLYLFQIQRKIAHVNKENIIIEKGTGFVFGEVVRLERDYAIVLFGEQRVLCHANQGMSIIAGPAYPEFLSGTKAGGIDKGDSVILRIADDGRTIHADVWGTETELRNAEKVLESRAQPAPVPTRAERRKARRVPQVAAAA